MSSRYKYAFTIQGLPKMANGSHGSWKRDYSEKQKWRLAVAKELIGFTPRNPCHCIRAHFIRCSSSEPDFDGLVHGFKPIVDALVHFGVVENDKTRNIKAEYRWEKAPQGKGHIKVEIEECESQP